MTLSTRGLVGLPATQTGDPCYQLVRRAYKQWFGIELTNYAVPTDWDQSGLNLILEHYADEGFSPIDAPLCTARDGDVLVVQIGAGVPNHLGIFVGGDKPILHQAFNRMSELQSFGGVWRRRVCAHLRHRDVHLHTLPRREVRVYDLLTQKQKDKLRDAGVSPPPDI